MNSDFIKKGIVLPLVTAIAVGVTAFLFTGKYIDNLSPFAVGTEVLYFEKLDVSDKQADDLTKLADGDSVGTISSGDELSLVFNGDYSRLLTDASLSDRGSVAGEDGTAYVEILNSNADKFKNVLSIKRKDGEFRFKKTEEKTVESENDVFLIFPRAQKSIVVYYRQKGIGGISSKYQAVIYEEAV